MTELACELRIIKIAFLLLNVLFCVVGIAIIIAGILTTSIVQDVPLLPEGLSGATYLLIVLGVLVFAVSFFGCCGACYEKVNLMKIYSYIVISFVVVEIVVTIYVMVKRNDMMVVFKKQLKIAMLDKYNVDPNMKKIVDKIQKDYECCGINHYLDYSVVPKSCCKNNKCASTDPRHLNNSVFDVGCFDAVIDVAASRSLWVTLVAVLTCMVQLLGIQFACCLILAVHDD